MAAGVPEAALHLRTTPRAPGSEGRAGGAGPVRHTPGGGFLQVGRCFLPLGPASLRPGKVSFLAGIQTKRLVAALWVHSLFRFL